MNSAQLVKDISGSYDAFSRLRISTPYTLFNSKLLYDKQPFVWDELQVSGSGTTSVHSSNEANVTLSVSNNTAGYRVRQTFESFNYQPGKSQLIMMSGIIGEYSTGIIKRIGQFNENNGIFFQSGPDDYYIVKRTYVSGAAVDTAIPQSLWNKNKLDSNSQIEIDFNKTQIFYFNYEWLGVGDICCGVFIGNKLIELHQFYHANENTTVSLSKPNLPLRYEIRNLGSGSASSMKCICTNVMSEGGQENSGYKFAIDRLRTPIEITTSSVLYPILTIRLKSGRPSVNVNIESINIIATNNNVIFRWGIYLNPTFAGTALTYTDSYTGNFQFCNTNTVASSISGGILVDSGYGIGTQASLFTTSVASKLSLGTYINGTPNVLCLAIERLDNQTNTFYASMSIRDSV